MTKLLEYSSDCIKFTHVELALVLKMRNGDFVDDVNLKEYGVCMAKKIGFVDSSGNVQKSVIARKMGNAIGDNALTSKLTEDCWTEEGDLGDRVMFL